MTIKELIEFNKHANFIELRLESVKRLLLFFTFGGIGLACIWQIIDSLYFAQYHLFLLQIRIIFILGLIINLIVALARKTNFALKQHLLLGFYLGTIFCLFMSVSTLHTQAPYWFCMFFLLTAWFVIVPFSFLELIVHSLSFLSIYLISILALKAYFLTGTQLAEIIFLYSGTLGIGFYVGYIRNKAEAEAYASTLSLKRKHAELEKYKLVLEQAPVAMYIINKNMCFEYVNPSFTKQSGYTKADLLNKHVNDTIYKAIGGIPESRRQIAEALERGETFEAELYSRDKSGEYYWANTIASPINNEEGKVDGYIIIQQDITEHKQMELALQESENLYRTLIEDSLDCVVLTQDFKFIYFNKVFCKAMAYSQEELMSIDPVLIIAPEERERVLGYHQKRMSGEVFTQNYVAKFVRKDGLEFIAELNATSIQIKGKPASLITMRDITAREQLSQALRESEAKYKMLVENSQDGILIFKEDIITYANPTISKMLGYNQNEILNRSVFDFLDSSCLPSAYMLLERRLNGEMSTINMDFRFMNKSGELIEAETISTILEFNGENVAFFTVHDVTESNRMKDALTKSEHRFRELTEMLPQAVYELDVNNVPTFMNKTGREMFKLGDMKFGGSKAYDFFSPEDTKRMKDSLEYESKGVELVDGDLLPISSRAVSYTAHRTDGTTFPVLIYGTPIVEDGKVTGSRGIIIDITERVEMEKALQESELRYRTLIQSLQEGLFVIQDGKFVFLNNAIVDIVGYSVEELTGESFLKVIASIDKELVATNYQLRVNGEISPSNYEVRLIKKDGLTEVPVILTITVTEYQGKWALLGTAKDITERIKAEEAIRESEEKYRLLFEAESDAIFMIDVESGQILDVNPAATRTYGYSREELLQMKNTDVSAEPDKTRDATNRNDTKVLIRYHRKKDGSIIPVELSAGFTAFRDKNIQIVTARDITESQTMQDALRESERKYRDLVDNATDGIVVTQEGKLKLANKAMCEILQYSFDELCNQTFYQYVLPEDHEEMAEYHRRRMAGDQFNILYRARLIRKDGLIITVELNARTLEYNNHPAAFIIVRDITERIAIEDELKIAKTELEILNKNLESRVSDSSKKLAETHMQLVNLQKENLQSQFDVLRQQVNPHFLFNSLNVLTSLIKIEPDLAEQFSEHLSKVYRYVLENKDNDWVDLNTELRFLDAYIFLLNIRFVDKIKVNIDIPANMLSAQIIPLAMQLLIENAIKHNIMSKSKPLVIDVFIDAENYLNVINNLQERPTHISSTGVGLKNIENRYHLLNNTQAFFEKTETQFIAKVPLVLN